MTFATDFIPYALRTESNIAPLSINREVFLAVLNASIAVGNLTDFIKKKAAYNKPISIESWQDNVGALVTTLPDLLKVMNQGQFDLTPGDQPSTINTRLFHGVIGLFTESTELMEAMRSAYVTGTWDEVNLKEELGDQEWYQAILVDELKANMESIQQRVIEKLKARYPEKYSDDAAINRDVAVERKILEA